MGSLFKIIIFTAPLAALVFYFVVVQQGKMDAEMEKESLRFEQEWAEMKKNSPFVPLESKMKYKERAESYEQRIREMEEKKKKKEEKLEKFEEELEKALQEEAKKKK